MSEHEKVKQFHEAMGLPVKPRPEVPDSQTIVLRCRLLLEETMEFIHASGCYVSAADGRVYSSGIAPDLSAMAQENADVRYIAYGNDLAMGVDGRVFDEVHAANMRKEPGKKRSDGKVVKPDGWAPPNIERLLREWEP